MQPSTELTLSPTFISDSAQVIEEYSSKKTLSGSNDDRAEESQPSDEESGDYEEEDFSFSCIACGDESPISADDAFQNGQIKPIFPLFDQSLMLDSKLNLPHRPPVKVFVEAKDVSIPPATEAEIFCEWSGKAVEASPEVCKKSSSTGFSKLFRFRDLLNRSNSDGRDAFVFLNGSTSASSKREEKRETISAKKITGEVEATVGGAKVKAKEGGKSKTTSLSAHYNRNRALKEGDRRRTYLPYRTGLVGFFTNVHGGLSRNVHPF